MLVPVENLSLADEVPLARIPPGQHWSENYCFFGHDYESNVGLYLHLGRWGQDPTIWREQVYIYLPDGTSLSYRSLGRGDCSEGPSGALLRTKCAAAGELWQVDSEGRLIQGSQFTAAEVVEVTRLTSLDQYADDLRLTLQAPDRRIELIGRPLNLVVISCNEHFEFVYGTAPEIAPLTTFTQPVRYRLGDQAVGGHSERSIWLKPTRDAGMRQVGEARASN